MQKLPKLAEQYMIPVELFCKNGIRFFNKREYKESVDNFTAALRHCPEDGCDALLLIIVNNRTNALNSLTYDSWLYNRISVDEAIAELNSINYDDVLEEELKKCIRQTRVAILKSEGCRLQYKCMFDDAITKFKEALKYCDSLADKAVINDLINKNSSAHLSASPRELQVVFQNDITRQNTEIQEMCSDGNAENAATHWMLLVKTLEDYIKACDKGKMIRNNLLETEKVIFSKLNESNANEVRRFSEIKLNHEIESLECYTEIFENIKDVQVVDSETGKYELIMEQLILHRKTVAAVVIISVAFIVAYFGIF